MVEEVVDAEIINTLKLVMEDEFSLLINTYIKDSDARIQDIDNFGPVASLDSLRRTAHSFKGSSSNLGAMHLAALCLKLESACKEKSQPIVEGLIIDIKQEYKAVKNVLIQIAS